MKLTLRLFQLALCLLLGSCGNVGVEHYANERPTLDLPAFFAGPVTAWGIFQKPSGEVVKRFVVDISSSREGERLILDERFRYSDGTRQQQTALHRCRCQGHGRHSDGLRAMHRAARRKSPMSDG